MTEENGEITIYAKGVPAHASTPTLGVTAAGVTFECLEKAGFEDDFVTFYNTHLGTALRRLRYRLKGSYAYGDLTFCNGIVKTQDGDFLHGLISVFRLPKARRGPQAVRGQAGG